jgi:hypothetical protein
MFAPPCSPTSRAMAVPQRTLALPAPTISSAVSPTDELKPGLRFGFDPFWLFEYPPQHQLEMRLRRDDQRPRIR